MLDKLGQSMYFTTLDLKASYWQIRIGALCQEKTAFVTHRGLYGFCVIPFSVKNALPISRCLLFGLRNDNEQEFVDVYLDDIIIFSRTFSDH